MRKLPLLAAFLATSCGGEEGRPQNASRAEQPAAGTPMQTTTLTGLYESADTPPSQLCITELGRVARFGLVVRRNGRPGCSGAGTAARDGATLRLTMTGDSACAIDARIEDGRVTFPPTQPSGCSYYCAPGIDFGGTGFAKTGGSHADARRARDSVGDALCP